MRNYTVLRRNLGLLLLTVLTTAMMWAVISIQTREQAEAPVFSVESGFYEDAFYLEITAPEGCRIYYTLDSSIPDRNSIPYTGPVYIDNATFHENTYSMIEEVSLPNWQSVPPDFLIDKCTVIRAVAIPDSSVQYQNSEVITKSYFVGFSPDYFDNCGVISLVTDPDNLFDSHKGIYVTGDTLEKYLAAAETPDDTPWAYLPANYSERGQQWEREAVATFWDPQGNLLLTKDIGIRTQGGWSRAFNPRSLNLFAREEYDGTPYFPFDFFDNGKQLDILTLSVDGSGGYITRLNNYLMSQRAKDTACCIAEHRPYVMFLDGEYWGFYWLTEKYNSNYLQETYGLGNSDIIFIKNEELEAGYEEDFFVYKQMIQFFANHDMSHIPNYNRACELIDMDSFLDYYATMIYVGRSFDWPNYNESLWRTREVSDSPYADGKWRWIFYDCSGYCYDETGYHHNTLEWVLQENIIFRSLWSNPEFRTAFQTRIFQIADQYFDAQNMDLFLTDYEETMTAPLSKTWARFFGSYYDFSGDFSYSISRTKEFFALRRDVVSSWFA